MTPEQKIRHLIVIRAAEFNDEPDNLEFAKELSPEAVDEQFAALVDNDEHWDAMNEVREGTVETSVPSDWSRHYESKSVAAQYLDGSWVGWIYWFGGGKHGEPEGIPWIEDAYALTCSEEEKMVIVRTFEKAA